MIQPQGKIFPQQKTGNLKFSKDGQKDWTTQRIK
jgi:hypothetical protein